MSEIIRMGVNATDKSKIHKIEVEVEFEEPVTQMEAQERVARAIGKYIFEDSGGVNNE